jgi:aminomethyltransferase
MNKTVLDDYWILRRNIGWLDFSARSRLLIKGGDRKRFLHGQVTNDVNRLGVGQGCYAAIVTAKGKIESDVNIYCLQDALLLDFEAGLTEKIAARFEKYVIADDVQIEDAAQRLAMFTIQGAEVSPPTYAGGYTFENPRGTRTGFDVFAPVGQNIDLPGRRCSGEALEIVRIESGIPRFGIDMDETNLAPEAGIEARAISYTKGCYIGQEVISRIRTYGQVARALRGLRCEALPATGDKLFLQGKEVGYVTSAIHSPVLNANIALGYVRREHNAIGTKLDGAEIVQLPFVNPSDSF